MTFYRIVTGSKQVEMYEQEVKKRVGVWQWNKRREGEGEEGGEAEGAGKRGEGRRGEKKRDEYLKEETRFKTIMSKCDRNGCS